MTKRVITHDDVTDDLERTELTPYPVVAAGNDITVTPVTNAAGRTTYTIENAAVNLRYPTLALAKASSTLVEGTVIETLGYTTLGDLGGAVYNVRTTAAFGGVPNGIGDHATANGLVLKLVQNADLVIGEQYGCNPTTECSANFQEAVWVAAELAGPDNASRRKSHLHVRTDMKIKDQIMFTRRDLSDISGMSVTLEGKVTAVLGGDLSTKHAPFSTPIFYWRAGVGETYMSLINCDHICSGIVVLDGAGMRMARVNVIHQKKYGILLADKEIATNRGGSNGAFILERATCKQWLQSDGVNWNDDTKYTADCLVIGNKDMTINGGFFGWSRTALKLLGKTPLVDLGVGAHWSDRRFEGRTVYEGFESTSGGDVFCNNLHLMQGRNGGPARMDNLVNGGPILIESFSNSNPVMVSAADLDTGTCQIYAGGIRINVASNIVGEKNQPSTAPAVVIDPAVRIYADGTAQPSPVEIIGGAGMSVGFYNFEGSTWVNDYQQINYLGRAESPGWTGPVMVQPAPWVAATGGTFPVWSGPAGFRPSWVVGGTGTELVPVVISGQTFVEGDTLTALVQNPSTTVYAGNWHVVRNGKVDQIAQGSQIELRGTRHVLKSKPESGLAVDEFSYPSGAQHKVKVNVGTVAHNTTFDETDGGRLIFEADGPIQMRGGWEFANAGTLQPTSTLAINLGDTTRVVDKVHVNKLFLGTSQLDYVTGCRGTPEAQISAPQNTFCLRFDGGLGTRVYHKTGGGTGNTGWTAIL